MRIANYMQLDDYPFFLSLKQDRTRAFRSVQHAHQGVELLYIHEGTGQAVIGERSVAVRPGSLLVIPPHQLHQLRIDPPSPAYVRTMILFEPNVLDVYLKPFPDLYSFVNLLLQERSRPIAIPLADRDRFEALLLTYGEQEAHGAPRKGTERLALLLLSIFQFIQPLWQPIAPEGLEAADQMLYWIDRHYAEPFELKRLAKSVHLSPAYASALFRKRFGRSLTSYLKEVRIRQACWLLKTSRLSVGQIGQTVGLGNESYFCQLFRQQIGVSPFQYKKTAAGQQELESVSPT